MIDELSQTWLASDGWPLRHVQLAPSPYVPRRGALLFLNGRADHLEKYAETLEDWAKRGWCVDSFDWRGQGGSGRFHEDSLLGHVDDFTLWLDDLQAFVRDWKQRDTGPHVIVGHSMGGHLLIRALGEKRFEVDAATLVAPMLGIYAGGLPHPIGGRIARAACAMGYAGRSLWSSRMRDTAMNGAIRTTLTHSKMRFEQEMKVRRERPDLVMDAPSWGWLNAAYQSIELLGGTGFAESIETPVLLLASKADRLVSFSAIERMAARLPNVRTHYYESDVAHEILREVDEVRDDALASIDAFFDAYAPHQPKQGAFV